MFDAAICGGGGLPALCAALTSHACILQRTAGKRNGISFDIVEYFAKKQPVRRGILHAHRLSSPF